MRFEEVHKIGLLGGGVMGGGIGQVLAIGGLNVVIRDLTDEVLQATHDTIFDSRWGIKRSIEIGKLPYDKGTDALEKIQLTKDLADMADCDFIIEAVPEDLELKQKVFKELDGIVKPEAIFTSNTSGFVIEELARDVSDQRKTQFAGMHFASPVPAMRMCEVIYTPDTSQETIDTTSAVGEAGGKVICMVKDMPGTYGFLLNRIFGAARREAQQIVDDGIATQEDIDKAMMTGRNWPVGFWNSRGTRTGWK